MINRSQQTEKIVALVVTLASLIMMCGSHVTMAIAAPRKHRQHLRRGLNNNNNNNDRRLEDSTGECYLLDISATIALNEPYTVPMGCASVHSDIVPANQNIHLIDNDQASLRIESYVGGSQTGGRQTACKFDCSKSSSH